MPEYALQYLLYIFPTRTFLKSDCTVQCSPFILLYLGSIPMGHAISELCYKGTILERNYRKMTLVKCHGKKLWEPQSHKCYIDIRIIRNKVCYKGTALYTIS